MSPWAKRANPVAILDQQGTIGPHLVIERIDRPLVGKRAEHGAPDIARQHLAAGEHDDAEQPQRDE